MKRLKDYLADKCNTVQEYMVRREFYGYLTKTEGINLVNEEFEENVSGEILFIHEPKDDHYINGYNLNIFNNIHLDIPPITPEDNSIFNLLDDDIHKNY